MKKMIRVAFALAALVAAAAALRSAPAEKTPSIAWGKDFKKALAEARTAQKPVVVDFWAEWCHWCHELDSKTYTDARVTELASGFVAVKVDTEGSSGDQQAAAKYQVETLPTIAFLTPEGRLFYRIDGFQDATQFAATLAEVQKQSARVLGWERALAADKNDAEALAGLGRHLFDREIFEDSRDTLLKARANDASRPVGERKHTRVMLGIIHFFAKKHGDSEKMLKEALALAPADAAEDATAHYALGKTYLKWGKRDLARASFEAARAAEPDGHMAKEAQAALDKMPSPK